MDLVWGKYRNISSPKLICQSRRICNIAATCPYKNVLWTGPDNVQLYILTMFVQTTVVKRNVRQRELTSMNRNLHPLSRPVGPIRRWKCISSLPKRLHTTPKHVTIFVRPNSIDIPWPISHVCLYYYYYYIYIYVSRVIGCWDVRILTALSES